MKTPLYLLWSCAFFLAGCGGKSSPSSASTSATNTPGSNPLNAPAEYVGAIVNAHQDAVRISGTVSLQQAIQNFSVEHGRYPKNLDELVQARILPKLPAPPYGMRFVYDANAGTVKVEKQ